jgi:hypothetical protein
MGIDVVWRTSDGRQIATVPDRHGLLAGAMRKVQASVNLKFTAVSAIDLYGDGLVMPPQTETLANELALLRSETDDVETRIHLGRVISLARGVASVVGSYLECLGD